MPQLAGFLNTQVEEQLHRGFVKDTYFLDNMCPSNHIFVMRHLIEVHNRRINSHALMETQRRTGMKVSTDTLGRLFATTGMIQ